MKRNRGQNDDKCSRDKENEIDKTKEIIKIRKVEGTRGRRKERKTRKVTWESHFPDVATALPPLRPTRHAVTVQKVHSQVLSTTVRERPALCEIPL
jgi:hypothetical protein